MTKSSLLLCSHHGLKRTQKSSTSLSKERHHAQLVGGHPSKPFNHILTAKCVGSMRKRNESQTPPDGKEKPSYDRNDRNPQDGMVDSSPCMMVHSILLEITDPRCDGKSKMLTMLAVVLNYNCTHPNARRGRSRRHTIQALIPRYVLKCIRTHLSGSYT